MHNMIEFLPLDSHIYKLGNKMEEWFSDIDRFHQFFSYGHQMVLCKMFYRRNVTCLVFTDLFITCCMQIKMLFKFNHLGPIVQ